MTRLVVPTVLALAIALTAACVINTASSHPTIVRQRASYDLQCDERQIRVQNIGGNSYAAEGCGARAVYNCGQQSDTCVREAQTTP